MKRHIDKKGGTETLYVSLSASEAAALVTDLVRQLARDTHHPDAHCAGLGTSDGGCFSTTTGDGAHRLVITYEPPLRESP